MVKYSTLALSMVDPDLKTPSDGTDDVRADNPNHTRALLQRAMADTKGRSALVAFMQGISRPATEGEASTELSPELTVLLGKLKARYEKNTHNIICHRSIPWEKVEAKLRANPAKLAALKKMDDSGGAPDMTGVDGTEFLFDDIAEKLTIDRRNLNYADAFARAEAMGGGVKLTSPERYESLKNDLGIVMDIANGETDWVWLNSAHPKYVGESGTALAGGQRNGKPFVGQIPGRNRALSGAFRCSLRV